MDHLPLAIVPSSPEGKRVVDAYKKAVTTVATATAYVMLARGMARELLPDELRSAIRWGVESVRVLLGRTREKGHGETNTIVIRRQVEFNTENHLFTAALTYLGSIIDPRTMRRVCLARSKQDKETDGSTRLCMEPGGSTTDTFDGVVFTWTSAGNDDDSKSGGAQWGPRETTLELSFFEEHTDTALERYVPFVMSTAEQLQRQDRALKIFLNEGGWHGINHHHPATFHTLAMDRFLKRKEYYLRIGKAWKRGYLLYGPPGTGKSSLVAAMANYLRFNLYDLDLSKVYDNSDLHRLLIDMPNKSILVIEDIDCCFDAKSREKRKDRKTPNPPPADDDDNKSIASDNDDDDDEMGAYRQHNITLSGLLNYIDGLWSTSGEERIIIFFCHQLQGPPRPGAAAAGTHGHAHPHGLLWLGSIPDASPQLLRPGRPRSVPGDTTTARQGGGDTGRGVRDAATERRRRDCHARACEIPRRQEAWWDKESDRHQERRRTREGILFEVNVVRCRHPL